MATTKDAANQLLQEAGIQSALTHEIFERIRTFFELRSHWGSAHNIAGPRSMADPWRVDLIDAVALAQVLHSELPVVDVGTGSGTPGMLLACLWPKHPIVLVEPIAKRTAFLRHAARSLDLKSVKTIRGRWPCPHPHAQVQVVSRAVIDPEVWPSLAVQGGESVLSIIRMLALQRPPMTHTEYALADSIEYSMPSGGGARRIERWAREGV